MKKKVMVYIDEGVWVKFKERAWEERKSASSYLEGLISLWCTTGKKSNIKATNVLLTDKVDTIKPGSVVKSDDDVVGEAQAKLKKIQEGKGINQDWRSTIKPTPKGGKKRAS